MTKRLWLGMAAALLTAASVVTVASAGGSAGNEPRAVRRGGGRGAALAKYLGLTEQQQASWRALHEQRREEMTPLVEEGKALRQRLRDAVGAQSPDPTAGGPRPGVVALHRAGERATAAQPSTDWT